MESVNIVEAIKFISSIWTLVLFLLGMLGFLVGIIVYRISPLQWLEEIKHKQDVYRRKEEQELFKRRMVKRHLDLGSAFLDAYELDAAKADFEKALKLDPLNMEAQMGLCKAELFEPILKNDYRPQVAAERLRNIQEENPNDKHVFLFLGQLYLPIDLKMAEKYFKDALDQDSNLGIAYNNLGYIYDRHNQFDEALNNYERAADLLRWNTMILNNLGYHYLQARRYTEAIQQYELLLSLDKSLLIAHWNLSNAYRLAGRIKNSYRCQDCLLRLLDDEEVVSLKKNQGPWLFHIGPDQHVIFKDLPEKRCYSYFSMALTCHLLSQKAEADTFFEKACGLEIDDETSARKLIFANILQLQREQRNLENILQNFKDRTYLVGIPEQRDRRFSTNVTGYSERR